MALDEFELARRLKAARKAAAVTQDQAAAAAGISRTAITQMEAAKRSVSGLELDRLAKLYGFDLSDLLGREYSDGDVVGQLLQGAGPEVSETLGQALERCRSMDGALARLERIVGLARPLAFDYRLPTSISSAVAKRQGVMIAVAERRRLSLDDAPVADVVAILEANGVLSASVELPDHVQGLMMAETGKSPTVVVNSAHTLARQRLSLAEEYGHVLLDRASVATLTLEAHRRSPFQTRARAFAAAFLMPAGGLMGKLAEWGKGPGDPDLSLEGPQVGGTEGTDADAFIHVHDIASLADEFIVPRPALMTRLVEIGCLPRGRAERLQVDEAGTGQELARLMGLDDPSPDAERRKAVARMARLAMDAFERGGIDGPTLATYLPNAGVRDGSQQPDMPPYNIGAF